MSKKLNSLPLIGTFMSILLLFSCSNMVAKVDIEDRFSSNNSKWSTGIGPLRGHEDLTRIAIKIANISIEDNLMISGYYPNVRSGDSGIKTDNKIVKGNYLTDFPNDFIKEFYHASDDNWHTSPRLQHLHSLRGYEGGIVENARTACDNIQRKIVEATDSALDNIKDGNSEDGYILLGHVTHIIQDSFSYAHTVRSGPDFKMIDDICTYGEKFSGVCYHRAIDHRDRVWLETAKCQLDATERDIDCLKPEALSSAVATAGYLVAVADVLEGWDTVESRLYNYFNFEDDSNLSGYLNCDTL